MIHRFTKLTNRKHFICITLMFTNIILYGTNAWSAGGGGKGKGPMKTQTGESIGLNY